MSGKPAPAPHLPLPTYGVPVIGTVGVLVLAKRKGIVPLVKPQLEKLAASGYFLSDEIIAAALDASGE